MNIQGKNQERYLSLSQKKKKKLLSIIIKREI
jgi:hypothetical protein